MAFAHSFPIDGAKPQDNDVSNKYPGPFPPEVAKAPFHIAPSEQELVGNPMPTRLRESAKEKLSSTTAPAGPSTASVVGSVCYFVQERRRFVIRREAAG